MAPPCLSLELAGEPTVVATNSGNWSRVSLSLENDVVLAHRIGSGFNAVTMLTWFDAWAAWPPPVSDEREIDGEALLVPSSVAGVTALSTDDGGLALNLTPGDVPLSIPLPESETGVALQRRGEGYVATTELEEGDVGQLIVRAFDSQGSALFDGTVAACIPNLARQPKPTLVALDPAHTLLAFHAGDPPTSCLSPPTRLFVQSLDESGVGKATLLDADDARNLASASFVRRTGDPLLVFARYDENGPASSMYVELHKVALDGDGVATSAIEPIGPTGTQPLDGPAIVELPGGGFVMAISVRDQPDQDQQLWVGRYDDEGVLQQELKVAAPNPTRNAPHAVASTDGSGVVIAWTHSTGQGPVDNEQMLMRLDCVDP